MAVLQMLRRSLSAEKRSALAGTDVPKGHFAVYVGESEVKRIVVLDPPFISRFAKSSLRRNWFHQPMRGLIVPCSKDRSHLCFGHTQNHNKQKYLARVQEE
ncbi:hypothetical protein Sango_0538700 [Sesamum angolense]|uniref:SAUR family protein n=1 Tax=Sesamum angolense TaxID=2727404 RepID=A0AAE1X4Q8_9LAMI|nr:hypothetical protein Sango_0538700 [Sesamum angolense]